MIDTNCPNISIQRQCDLVGISRSGYYYQPCAESPENLNLMNLIDQIYTKWPFYGVRRIHSHLQALGYPINEKRVRRLMRLMGLEAIYPKPNLSAPDQEHIVYPYLLRGVDINRINHVWSTDITYVPMQGGFMYLTAVIDWFSRYVLSWEISNSLDVSFCISALQEALKIATPDIFNTDQGAQFTSNDFTGILKSKDIQISMDGKGRALDNVFVERLWRSVKYESIYLKSPSDGFELWQQLDNYFKFYNHQRQHQNLGDKTPASLYKP